MFCNVHALVLLLTNFVVVLSSKFSDARTPQIHWENFNLSSSRQTAGFFTPYHLTIGGGERYFLSAVLAAQELGFAVDVLVKHDNACRSMEELLFVSSALQLKLQRKTLRFLQIDVHHDGTIVGPKHDLFFLLGNEKYPEYSPMGNVNLYMCQFPFDLDRFVPPITVPFFNFDNVLLNSKFSMQQYLRFAHNLILLSKKDHGVFPTVDILHPPVLPLIYNENPERSNIVLLGRFFQGRQSKGHAAEIRIFKRLRANLPPHARLVFVGNVHPGQDEYVNK